MIRRLSPNINNQPILLHFFPYGLYFAMESLLHIVDVITGTNADAAGSVIGWYVFKAFVFAIISLLCSGILYPTILKWQRTGNKLAPYMLFVTLNYPVEYLFFSLPLLGLQAENLHTVLRTPGFSAIVVMLSSLLANYLRKFIAVPYRDLRQRIYQEGFIRFVSVFILAFIIIMVSLWLAKFI